MAGICEVNGNKRPIGRRFFLTIVATRLRRLRAAAAALSNLQKMRAAWDSRADTRAEREGGGVNAR